MHGDETPIARTETGLRILLSLLFLLIVQVIQTVLGVVILFEVGAALVTKRAPSARVRQFANRTLSYLYHVVRYLTYNEPELPFPFSDFPPAVEPSVPLPEQSAAGSASASGGSEE
jgi:Domain of unknown function (DUF4389)